MTPRSSGVGESLAGRWRGVRWTALLLLVLTFCVYAPTLWNSFVNFDDGGYVIFNPHVNTGLNLQNVKWSLTSFTLGLWAPLTMISHQLDWQLFGLKAGGHHFTSILLHGLSVVLLFWGLVKASGAIGRSAFAAALFALHPLNVESVAWVAERKNVLSTLFFLLAVLAYAWYSRNPSVKRYLPVAVLFVLGLASKPMVITLPFVLLLIDYWPLQRIKGWQGPSKQFPVAQLPFWKLVWEKLPLLPLSAASAVLTVLSEKRADAIEPFGLFTFGTRLSNVLYGYGIYLWETVYPRALAPFYPYVPVDRWQVGLAAVCLVLLGIAVWKLRSSRPYLLWGYLWFLGTLVPVIGVIQVGAQSHADRYVYIPLIGILVAVAWLLSDLADSQGISIRSRVAFAAVVLAAFSVLTVRQERYWRNSVDLWTHALQVTPSNYIAEENLALPLMDTGQEQEALTHYENVLKIRPNDPTALLSIAGSLVKQKRFVEAAEAYNVVIHTSNDPRQTSVAYRGLAAISDQTGDRSTARQALTRAVQVNPADVDDLYNLTLIESQEGAEKLSRILATHPTADGYFQLGQLLQATNKTQDARAAYEKALKLNPNLSDAKKALETLTNGSKP